MKMRVFGTAFIALAAFGAATFVTPSAHAQSAANTGTFSMQLTPSPMVETVKPGVAKTVPLTIRNNSAEPEVLKIEVRHFTFNSDTGVVDIADAPATDYAQWVTFSAPKFTVPGNEDYTQNVKLNFPKDSGFSYSFVVVISRQAQAQSTSAGRLLEGSIADFGLVNVDRPGASRALEVGSIKASSGIYEYVPAKLSINLKNTGNTIVQPLGNIFIGRGEVKDPISTLPFNANQSYVLPGTNRTINATWEDGFPRIETTTASDGSTKSHAVWNWADISKFRIGKYTAKVVAVYDNGTFDVPINVQTTFWILPWKILGIALLIVLVFAFGIFMIIRNAFKSARSRRGGGRGFRL